MRRKRYRDHEMTDTPSPRPDIDAAIRAAPTFAAAVRILVADGCPEFDAWEIVGHVRTPAAADCIVSLSGH